MDSFWLSEMMLLEQSAVLLLFSFYIRYDDSFTFFRAQLGRNI